MFTFLLLIFSVFIILLFGICHLRRHRIRTASSTRNGTIRTAPAATLIVLGSGGHTAEMLRISAALDQRHYQPRIYVCADTDRLSANAAEVLEEERIAKVSAKSSDRINDPEFQIVRIRRSRAVHQSYVSSIRTTAQAFLADAIPLVWHHRPELILCNGPGTCVPLLLAAWGMRFAGLLPPHTRLVFVESFCRVRSLSLSGRLMARLVDAFVVQWPELAEQTGATYVGKIM